MDAIEKTNSLVRKNIHIDLLYVNELNPNKMTQAQFNMLYDNMGKVGFVDPLFVREMPDGRYRIVGGAHRYEVAKLWGFEQAPCTIVTDKEFDEDQEKFQIVRMNVIRGQMTPDRFIKLYESLGKKYSDEVMQDAFGFVEEQEFRKFMKQVEKSIPAELKSQFQDAAKEIKTIDGLSKLLNQLFSKYGDTLPYGYMLLDFGGKESVWLRLNAQRKAALYKVGTFCRENNRSVDAIVGGLLKLVAEGKLQDQLLQLIANSDPVQIPEHVQLPTEEVL